MGYAGFGLLILGGLLVVLSGLPAGRSGGRPGLREILTGGLRAFERRMDRLPWVEARKAQVRKRELHFAVRSRLPSFWGDVGIYLREGRKDLRGAVLAAVDRMQDPLSEILRRRLQRTALGTPLDAALREAAEEIGFRPFTNGVLNVLSTLEQGGDIVRVLEVLRDQAMAELSFARREQAATLENRLILFLWPILFAALILAVLLPIAAGGLAVLGRLG